jgi:NAD(P)-dependent dehydrogenase (short-subunit alcohol dehydrogenase family)
LDILALRKRRSPPPRLDRRAVAIEADLAQTGAATRCVHDARRALGGLDVLVVCASVQYRTPFEEVTAEQIERQI